jgi:electron transport complex protein RnfG
MSLAVFFVENAFRDQIIDAAAARANTAKDEVLPGALASGLTVSNALDSDEFDAGDTGIKGIFYYEGLGYVYQVEFMGHIDVVEYMFGFDEDGNVTGYKTLSNIETAGLGAKIGDPQYWTQFLDKSLDDLAVGNIDGWAGATSTTEKWQASFVKVIKYHYEEFLGIETYEITNTLSGLPSSVTMVEEVQKHGVTIEYVFYVEFTGYSDEVSTYKFTVNADTHAIKSLQIIETFESDGIGAFIASDEFAAQFVGMTATQATDNEFDDVGGSTYPITLAGFTASFNEAFYFYRDAIEGYTVPTPVDVTDDFWGVPDSITSIETLTVDGTITQYILTVNFQGYISEDSVFTITIDASDHSILEVEFLEMNETTGIGALITELVFT